jgi:hypothetical protein
LTRSAQRELRYRFHADSPMEHRKNAAMLASVIGAAGVSPPNNSS